MIASYCRRTDKARQKYAFDRSIDWLIDWLILSIDSIDRLIDWLIDYCNQVISTFASMFTTTFVWLLFTAKLLSASVIGSREDSHEPVTAEVDHNQFPGDTPDLDYTSVINQEEDHFDPVLHAEALLKEFPGDDEEEEEETEVSTTTERTPNFEVLTRNDKGPVLKASFRDQSQSSLKWYCFRTNYR